MPGVRFLFTERDASTKVMALRRGFTVSPGETALVVEDVITTGGSTQDVIEVLTAAGAKVLAAGSIIDRSGGHASVGVPRVALATLQVVPPVLLSVARSVTGVKVVTVPKSSDGGEMVKEQGEGG